jgi:hypothetical protein
MKPSAFVLGFLPWIAFGVVANRMAANGVAWSALIAVGMTAVALVLARRRHGPVTLNAVSLVLFTVIAGVGFAGGPGVDDWLYRWGRPLVGVVLGVYVLATSAVRPFTAEYARQSTPREYWGTPTFRSVNQVISAAWGAGLVVIGAAGVLVTLLDAHATTRSADHLAELVLNWVVPIAVIWGLVEFSRAYPDRATSRPEGSAPHRPRTGSRA